MTPNFYIPIAPNSQHKRRSYPSPSSPFTPTRRGDSLHTDRRALTSRSRFRLSTSDFRRRLLLPVSSSSLSSHPFPVFMTPSPVPRPITHNPFVFPFLCSPPRPLTQINLSISLSQLVLKPPSPLHRLHFSTLSQRVFRSHLLHDMCH